MRPFSTDPAHPLGRTPAMTQFSPALTSFADEVSAMIARVFAYVGTFALITILAVHFWDGLPLADDPAAFGPNWRVAGQSYPGFALGGLDRDGKSATYAILRHPGGGRKDIFAWAGQGTGERGPPIAELEIYQLGDEAASAPRSAQDLALRMPPGGEPQAAGVVDSKFGAVALLWRADPGAALNARHIAGGCLGFFKSVDDPALRISGWSCRGTSLPAERNAVACMLERLTLLSAGNEPRLAEFFAAAELRRRGCTPAGVSGAAGSWINTTDDPGLRGAL